MPSNFIDKIKWFHPCSTSPGIQRTRRGAPGPDERALEDVGLNGVSLHCGLIAPLAASQSFVPGDATEAVRYPSCILPP